MRARTWWQRQAIRAEISLLGLASVPLLGPGAPMAGTAGRAWVLPTFSEPVLQNATGLPARIHRGLTSTPQVLAALENQLRSNDPVQGVSISAGGRWPMLPGRRPPLPPPTDEATR